MLEEPGDGCQQSMPQFFHSLSICMIALISSGCDTVNQYASRVTVQNENASRSLNEETLLNILRAKDFRPLNFIATTQMVSAVNEQINIGLPTITFGPRQEASSRQFAFGPNNIQAAAGLQYQSNPLITADFIKGQTAPLAMSNLALLLANFPREIVYYAAIDRIRVVFPGYALNLINDPSNNNALKGEDCKAHEDDLVESKLYSQINEPYCNFSKFRHIVNALIKHGVTAELINVPEKDGKDDSESSKKNSSKFIGQFCYDQSLDVSTVNKSSSLKACGSGKLFTDSQNLSISRSSHKIEVLFRSPTKMYRYAGEVAITDEPLVLDYRDRDAFSFQGERFINIIKDNGSECDVSVTYGNQRWCVPSIGSRGTFAVFSMLQNLRNLSISPDDTNRGLILPPTN